MIDWLLKLVGQDSDQADATAIAAQDQMAEVDLVALSKVIGCPIEKEDLFLLALQHRSLLRGLPDAHLQSNERLEYFGDAVVGFLVAEHLFQQYPDKDEGFLTRLRAKLVNGRALAQRAREINLGDFVQVSDSLNEDQKNGNSILADAFESIIGAIYLDQGIDAARAFVTNTVLSYVDLDQLARIKDNHKSLLLEFVQARSRKQPEYEVVSESGPSHDKRFVVAVIVDGEEFGRGEDRSKKSAEQTAARIALERLQKEEKLGSK